MPLIPNGIGTPCPDCRTDCVINTHTIEPWPLREGSEHPGQKPVSVPPYLVRFPYLKRVSLASVKTGIYRPDLPSFRRQDRDAVLGRLTTEDCRYSTTLSRQDFVNATPNRIAYPVEKYSDIMHTIVENEMLSKQQLFDLWLKEYETDWHQFLKTNRTVTPLEMSREDLEFFGYALRKERPELTSFWKKSMMEGPEQKKAERPTPADVGSRHSSMVYDLTSKCVTTPKFSSVRWMRPSLLY